jgi:hypothetical protein
MTSARHLPPLEVRDLPPAPASYRPMIGPGVVAAGVGLASGEFVLWPYSASQAGLVLLWGAARGIRDKGFGQPLVLLVVSSCVGGFMMAVYSMLLIVLNRRGLPAPIRIGGARIAALVWSTAMFGLLAVQTIRQQLRLLAS